MIDVRVGANDGLHGELVAAEQVQNAAYFIARIYDQGLARRRVGNDRAVALQHSHRNGDVQKAVLFHAHDWNWLVHQTQYSIRCAGHHAKTNPQTMWERSP